MRRHVRRHIQIVLGLLIPASLAGQSPAAHAPLDPVMYQFERFADIFGSRLVAAFDSIPAERYAYRPTPAQQSIGYIAQHLEAANFGLCARFGTLKHADTARDSLADTVKARWPKDTLVTRLRASLRFCDAALEELHQLDSPALASNLLAFETDLAEHYSQISSYMRLLGLVPPSALKPKQRTAIELTAPTLSQYVGEYQIVAGMLLDVTLHDDALFVRSSLGGAPARLWPESVNDFFLKEVDAQVTFTRDAAGTVTGLVVHQFGRDRPATKQR